MPGKRNGDFRLGPNAEAILSGDLTGVQRALRQARRQNRLVEQYLTFKRPLPTDMPETYSLGSDEEAIVCLTYLSDAWADHPLATSWLWEQLAFRPASAPPQQNRLF